MPRSGAWSALKRGRPSALAPSLLAVTFTPFFLPRGPLRRFRNPVLSIAARWPLPCDTGALGLSVTGPGPAASAGASIGKSRTTTHDQPRRHRSESPHQTLSRDRWQFRQDPRGTAPAGRHDEPAPAYRQVAV